MPHIIYKNEGETPLFAIERFRTLQNIPNDISLTYAGRLDPLAEGLLIVLVGDECKEKENYLSLPKTYEFEVLLGFETDSYDILGIVSGNDEKDIDSVDFVKMCKEMEGDYDEPYPIFSSKTVLGKPLFVWAKEDKLKEIEIPTHVVSIKKLSFLGKREISGIQLLDDIKNRIQKVEGDFRQEETIKKWEDALNNKKDKSFTLLSFEASVSSGAYIRSLAFKIGKYLGVSSLAYKIKRTKIGKYGEGIRF